MGDQHALIIKIYEQVFGAAPQSDDPATGEPFGEFVGQGKTQVRAARFQALDPAPFHSRRQATANGFYFR